MHLFFFASKSKKLLNNWIKYFKALNHLQSVIFNCYLQRDYFSKIIHYEKIIHQARLKLMRIMKKIRKSDEQKNLNQLEKLYETIFSLNTFKLRILDHTTFEVCEPELKKTSQSLDAALRFVVVFLEKQFCQKEKISLRNISTRTARDMLEKSAKMIGNLSRQIDKLEELYRTTLQVISESPIFFLFFVQDLIALRDQLEAVFLEIIE
ncbi:MAG TPA: hypothetical protein VLI69_01295 [Gammaproteobacteria bacterium]|nr:hypothetical protein [Gammaproteobacteria bacterium]